ncbi:hypothetical protein SAY86_020126 [Trapa natans]|uniref:Uncharacterized protein n=1 Tax=Trapa natans TaxID=22666 RepID=A0AAN7R3W7_TRANT|nr:hypothetical protein SAY86_020126 [Trapa natans]
MSNINAWLNVIGKARSGRLSDPSQYQSIVDAEWNIIYDKLDKCVQSGAKVVLSRLAIGDLATQLNLPMQNLPRVLCRSGIFSVLAVSLKNSCCYLWNCADICQ